MSSENRSENIRIVRARGPRAMEERLLEDLKRLLADFRAGLDAAGGAACGALHPVLVVVPTGSLRRHLATRVAAVLGPVALGVSVATPGVIARDVLVHSGRRVPGGGSLFGALARRAIAEEPVLREALEPFEDGFGAALGGIRDLLSAGLEEEQKGRLLAVLQEHAPGAGDERSGAVVRAAVATRCAMRDLGIGRESDVYADALRALEESRDVPRPWGNVLVYGFADAPGRTARFLGCLLRTCGGALYRDEPDDPASPGTTERGAAFVDAFVARLGRVATPEAAAPPPAPMAARPKVFAARGEDAEIREVAARIRRLLDGGIEPESVAVVIRGIDTCAIAIRRHFDLLGIPFSGPPAPSWLFPARRRLDAALHVVEDGERASADAWLDAREPPPRTGAGSERRSDDSDLRVGLQVAGAARLDQVAGLDSELLLDARDGLPLPARRGLMGNGGEEDRGSGFAGRMSHRRLPGARLRSAIERAQALISERARWPAEGSVDEHCARFGQLLRQQILSAEQPGVVQDAIDRALAALASLHRTGLSLDQGEFLRLLRTQLESFPDEPIGGRGGGVAILDVPRARSLCFEHLFVVGLNRDAWPRAASEDFLLSDAVRDRLRQVLPDLALRRHRDAEERYLFAQLLAAAPEVTLSWCRTDQEGHERSPSPFLEALSARERLGEELAAAPRYDLDALLEGAALLPACEAAVVAGLHGHRASVREHLAEALREAGTRFPDAPMTADAPSVAAARVAVLDEQDPDLRDPRGRARRRSAGAYQGFVGSARSDADPRRTDHYITRLEDLARCPWRTFLEKLLRLEALPDPASRLPALDAPLIGRATHVALEKMMVRALASRDEANLPAVALGEPVTVERPSEAEVERTIIEVARSSARQQGIHLAGLHRALALRIDPMVRRALDCDWGATGTVAVLGAEVEGEILLGREEVARSVRFRADRVDAHEGALLLTDYKTGKSKTRKALERGLRDGTMLQAAAYAASAAGATGRYLYLKPEEKPDRAALVVGEEADHAALGRAADILLAALHHGVLFPRVEDLKEDTPEACGNCEVAAACFQNDSGFRRRLRDLAHRAREASATRSPGGPDPETDPESLARAWFISEPEPDAAAEAKS